MDPVGESICCSPSADGYLIDCIMGSDEAILI